MKITNKHGLPEPIYQAILNDPYSKGDSDYSVTQIIAPVRQTILVQRHEDELEEDAMDRIWALMGKTAHKIFEDMPNYMDAIKERRFYSKFIVGGAWKGDAVSLKKLSGQADYIEHIEDPEVGEWLLRDFKMTSVWSFIFDEGKPKDDWISQLNVLKVLAAAENVHIGKMEITCIFRDWSQGEVDRRIQRGDLGYYPRTPVVTIGIPEWPYERALEYIEGRLRALEDAKDQTDDELPECTAEERWEQPTKYAVMKEGRKSAVRVLDSREEADQYMVPLGPQHSLEVRKGGSRRCQQYCAAAPFCGQWKREQGDG